MTSGHIILHEHMSTTYRQKKGHKTGPVSVPHPKQSQYPECFLSPLLRFIMCSLSSYIFFPSCFTAWAERNNEIIRENNITTYTFTRAQCSRPLSTSPRLASLPPGRANEGLTSPWWSEPWKSPDRWINQWSCFRSARRRLRGVSWLDTREILCQPPPTSFCFFAVHALWCTSWLRQDKAL